MKNLKLLLLILLPLFANGQIRIGDLNLKASVSGTEKIPVSGSGNPAINTNLIKTYLGWDANEALTVNGVRIGKMPGVTANSGLFIGNGAGVLTTWATSHGRNTVVGTSAGSSLTNGSNTYDGSYNSFFGYQAGRSATLATASSFFGYNSGNAVTTAINNSLFGANVASGASFNGSSNSFFGSNIATSATTAYENTVMGAGSGIGLTTGFRNSYFGLFAGAQTTTGSHNCAFGSESFQRIYTNTGNSGYGFYSGVYVMGANNTMIGAYAGGATLGLPPAGSGYNMNGNTFIGVNTGVTDNNANESVTGTNYSTFLGYQSGGGSSTQVEYSTALGYRAKVYTSRSMVFGSEVDADRVNYGFGGESYASGQGISFFKNAVTNPSGNPTNGFILYSDGGVAKVLNASGTAITVMGNPMTTEGDLILGGASGAATRLAIGTNAYVLTSNGTTASWAAAASGFADPMTTRGDIIIRNAANATARLGIGTATYVLTSDGTDVAWAASASGGWAVTGTTTITGNTVVDFGATGTTPYTNEFRADNLTTTSTVGRGLVLNNNTAATGGATVQYSPSLTLRGRAWTGAASQTVDFKQYALTASAATPTGNWILASSVNGGADVVNIRVHNNGNALGVEFNAGGISLIGTTNGIVGLAGTGRINIAAGSSSGSIQYNITSVIPAANYAVGIFNQNANITATSGTISELKIGSGFAPASGTTVYNMLLANQTINNAGNGVVSLFNISPTYTATGGDAYFLNYNPTVTSITGTHYAFRATSGSVLIGGTTLTTSAILDLQSTTQAFIPPRMTTTQRDNIATPSAGMVIYNTTTNKLNVYTTAWEAVTSI